MKDSECSFLPVEVNKGNKFSACISGCFTFGGGGGVGGVLCLKTYQPCGLFDTKCILIEEH